MTATCWLHASLHTDDRSLKDHLTFLMPVSVPVSAGESCRQVINCTPNRQRYHGLETIVDQTSSEQFHHLQLAVMHNCPQYDDVLTQYYQADVSAT